ncbi:hypothetical protein [Nocardioides salarius]|uniref:hypothetical protein n=1 Tax=Nocardioides salarius TaxID=374513 RepID=UPI0030F4DD17
MLVEATATGSMVELMSAGSDPYNSFVGEGPLVEAGAVLDVVCAKKSDYGGAATFGVLLPPELDLGTVDADRFAPGKVDGRSWRTVAFIGGSGINDADAVSQRLVAGLAERFEDLDEGDSCADNRVVMDTLARTMVTGS